MSMVPMMMQQNQRLSRLRGGRKDWDGCFPFAILLIFMALFMVIGVVYLTSADSPNEVQTREAARAAQVDREQSLVGKKVTGVVHDGRVITVTFEDGTVLNVEGTRYELEVSVNGR